jgi:hypothetical protein
MIIRRNERQPALIRQLPADCLAIFSVAIVSHDVAAISLRRRDLCDRCIVRHHDRRRDAEQGRCERNALRVISGRVRNDTRPALTLVKLGESVERTTKLERPHPLQVLALEEHFCTQLGIHRARTQDWRAVSVTFDAFRRGNDVVKGR